MAALPDITVTNTWVDVIAESGVPPAQVLIQPKGDNCLVQYGTEPAEGSKDGQIVQDNEILEVIGEANIWMRTVANRQQTRVHVAEFV